jgi:hypothetical protein
MGRKEDRGKRKKGRGKRKEGRGKGRGKGQRKEVGNDPISRLSGRFSDPFPLTFVLFLCPLPSFLFRPSIRLEAKPGVKGR